MAALYIFASSRNGTLSHGSTSDLSKRIWEHKEKLTPGFPSRYVS
jgi:putative endonuclease